MNILKNCIKGIKSSKNRKKKLKEKKKALRKIEESFYIIDLNKELNINFEKGESCSEVYIPEQYIKEVDNMNKEVDKEMEHIEKRFNRKDVKLKDFTGKEQRNQTILFMLMIAMLFPIIYYGINFCANKKEKILFTEEQKVDYVGTVLNVSMNQDTGMLDYQPEHLTVKIADNRFIELNSEQIKTWLDTELYLTDSDFEIEGTTYNVSSKLNLYTLDCYNNMMYIRYANDEYTGTREIIVADSIPDGLQLGEMQSIDSRVYENNSSTSVKSMLYSYDNSFLFYADTISGGELGTKTLSSRIQSLESSLNYSETLTEEVNINFKGLNTLKLSSIDCLKDAPGIYLNSNDGVLRLYNYKDDIAYVFITHLNNSTFMCNASDLVETNYEKLFVTKGFDDPESVGYRTFAITTTNSIYVFRVASEAPDTALSQLLEQFGIDRNMIEVKVVQQVIEVDEHINSPINPVVNEEDNEIEIDENALKIEDDNEISDSEASAETQN